MNNLAEYGNGQLVGKLIEEGAVDILIDHIAIKTLKFEDTVSWLCVTLHALPTGVVLESDKAQHCLSMMRRHGAIEAFTCRICS